MLLVRIEPNQLAVEYPRVGVDANLSGTQVNSINTVYPRRTTMVSGAIENGDFSVECTELVAKLVVFDVAPRLEKQKKNHGDEKRHENFDPRNKADTEKSFLHFEPPMVVV